MILIDWILLCILAVTMVICAASDLEAAIVPNKIALPAIAVTVTISTVECLMRGNGVIIKYLLNTGIITIVSILLYVYHVWGGGDSKLMILAATGIPVNAYYIAHGESFPLLPLVVMIFTLGYLFLIGDSTVRAIQKSSRTEIKAPTMAVACGFMKNYFIATAYVLGFDILLNIRYADFFTTNSLLLMLMNMFVVMAIFGIEQLKKPFIWGTILAVDFIYCVLNAWNPFSTQVMSYVLLAGVLLLRNCIQQYDCDVISTENLQPGMIISAGSYMDCVSRGFRTERVLITNDLRSKLTQEDITQIQTLKKKPETITIIRKIPFAIFILLGTVTYLTLGVLSL